MDFEWDPQKAEINLRKHRIAFDYASAVFLDPDRIEELDDSNYGEERWLVIGRIEELVIVLVYTLRDENVRIISARKGDRDDYHRYWTGQI